MSPRRIGELASVLIDLPDAGPKDEIVRALHGAIQFSSTTQASWSGKIYATPGNVLPDGTSVVAEFSITGGSLRELDWHGKYDLLELTFTSLGEEYTFFGHFDHYLYQVWGESTLIWPVKGVYTNFDIYGDPASLSIDPSGELFMQSASGCTGNGKIARSVGLLVPV